MCYICKQYVHQYRYVMIKVYVNEEVLPTNMYDKITGFVSNFVIHTKALHLHIACV